MIWPQKGAKPIPFLFAHFAPFCRYQFSEDSQRRLNEAIHLNRE
jgi:hypothetical protein